MLRASKNDFFIFIINAITIHVSQPREFYVTPAWRLWKDDKVYNLESIMSHALVKIASWSRQDSITRTQGMTISFHPWFPSGKRSSKSNAPRNLACLFKKNKRESIHCSLAQRSIYRRLPATREFYRDLERCRPAFFHVCMCVCVNTWPAASRIEPARTFSIFLSYSLDFRSSFRKLEFQREFPPLPDQSIEIAVHIDLIMGKKNSPQLW